MIRGLVNSILGVSNYDVRAPRIDTKAGTRAIQLQSMLGAQRAKQQAYSLAAGARGSSVPLAMREAQRRGVMAQQDLATQSMINTAQLEQGAAAQNAQMGLQAGLANQQTKMQQDASLMGLVGTGIGVAALASDERVKEDILPLRGGKPLPPTARFDDYTDLDAGGAAPIRIGGPPRPASARSPFPRPIVATPIGAPSADLALYNEGQGEPSVRPTAARITRIRTAGAQAGPGLTGDYGLTKRDVYDTIARQGRQNEPLHRAEAADAYRTGPSAVSMLGISPEDAQAAAAQEAAGLPVDRRPAYVPGGPEVGVPLTSWDTPDARQRYAAEIAANYAADQQRVSDAASKKSISILQGENNALRDALNSARSVAADVMDPAPGPVVHRLQPGATRGVRPAVALAAGRAKGGYDVTEQRGNTTIRTQSRPVPLDEQAALDAMAASAQPPVVHLVPVAEAPKAGKKKKMPSAVAMMAGSRVSGMQAKQSIDYYPSDEHVKGAIHRAELGFEKVRPVSFEYKEPFDSVYGDDRQYGVLAQDLEKAPATRSLVKKGPGGIRMVDENRATMLLLAHAADNEKRLRVLERKKKAG